LASPHETRVALEAHVHVSSNLAYAVAPILSSPHIARSLAARLGLSEARAVVTTMIVAGAAAGFVGWLQVAGLTGTLYPSVGGGLGFSGILVAMLGGLRPLGVLAAALALGALTTGAQGLQTGTGVPASISVVAQGLLLMVAAVLFRRRQAPQAAEREPPPVATESASAA
jgi:ABC-type uncharacterized transport system permease subunit